MKNVNEKVADDQFILASRNILNWVAQNIKILIIAIVVVVGVLGGYALSIQMTIKSEKAAQEKLYEIQKKYSEKKSAVKVVAQIETDLGDVPTEYEKFIEANKKTQAAKVAALELSQIYTTYKMSDKALGVLQLVDQGKKDLMSNLIKVQVGNLLVEKNDCKTAISTWDQVIFDKAQAYMHDELKLKQALCYDSLNEKDKSRALLEQIASSKEETSAKKMAEKYLRTVK